jgi:hypothetical protein
MEVRKLTAFRPSRVLAHSRPGNGAGTKVTTLTVGAGDQNDTAAISYLSASHIVAHGGAGYDTLTLTAIQLFGERRIAVEGFEQVNRTARHPPRYSPLTISAGCIFGRAGSSTAPRSSARPQQGEHFDASP